MSRLPDIDSTERAFIGALLLRPGESDAIVGLVSEDDFAHPANRAMYIACARLADRGEAIDVVAVERMLRASESFGLVGGSEGIGRYSELYGSAHLYEQHAKAIREHADVRKLHTACARICDSVHDASGRPREWLDEQGAFLAPLLEGRSTPDTTLLRDQADELFRQTTEGKPQGIKTGLHQLDTLTGGLQPSEMIVLGARTSHGKSALALTIALRSQVPTIMFSLEMSRKKLYPRLLAAVGEVDLSRIVHRRLEPAHRAALVRAKQAIDHLDLAIVDRRGISVTDIRMQTRAFMRHHARDGRAICIVDYVQITRPSRERSSREQEVSDVSRGLQALAGELDIPVLALAQISRGVETRAVKEPTLADLRESGALEQDARAVFLLWRPELWWDDETKERRKNELGIATLAIAKQSNGPTGSVPLRYHGKFTRFDNVEDDKQTEMQT